MPHRLESLGTGRDVLLVDETRVENLQAGVSFVEDVPSEQLQEVIATGRYRATTDAADLAHFGYTIITVPTPLKDTVPDLSFIEAAASTVEGVVRPGQLISLESTSYPGTTEDIVLPAIERAGYSLDGDEVYLQSRGARPLLRYFPELEFLEKNSRFGKTRTRGKG